jgi:CheY-like chemotaxis protein
MSPDASPTHRLGRLAVRRWLDRLDEQTVPAHVRELRTSQRYTYRPEAVQVELRLPDDESIACRVAGRNLSRDGIGFLTDRFVYPRTPCRLILASPFGHDETVTGRVARCRYLLGSTCLYEVGVVFDRPVDVAVFTPQAKSIRALLIDENAANHELVGSLLRPLQVELRCVLPVADQVPDATDRCDFILIDLDMVAGNAFELIRRLRATGFVGPVIGLTVRTGPNLETRCRRTGCTGYICKPIRRADLEELVRALIDLPLRSTLQDDPDLIPLIDRFVAGLPDKARQLALALDARDGTALDRLARELRSVAGSYGFDTITEEAAYLQTLLLSEEPLDQISAAVRQLMHLCLSARPATAREDHSSALPGWRRPPPTT